MAIRRDLRPVFAIRFGFLFSLTTPSTDVLGKSPRHLFLQINARRQTLQQIAVHNLFTVVFNPIIVSQFREIVRVS